MPSGIMLRLGPSPSLAGGTICEGLNGYPLSGPPLQAQVDAVSCFNFNAYANIITGVVIGLIVLVVWLKYKKQICDCES